MSTEKHIYKRLALVTGASSGLGAETCRQLQNEVDELWMVARRGDKLESLAQELSCNTRCFTLDLEDPLSNQVLLDELKKVRNSYHLDWLVLAAGWGKHGLLAPEQREQARSMIRLNILAPTDFLSEALPLCTAQTRVLVYASVAAWIPQPHFAVYAASKSYILSLVRALRWEYPCSITAVCPNPVATEFFDRAGGQVGRIKKLGVESPASVVHHSLRAAKHRRALSHSCFLARLIHITSKILPIPFILFCEKKLKIF